MPAPSSPPTCACITAKDFFVSQSALTGESMPVEKSAGAADDRPERRWSSPTPASWAPTCSAARPGASSSNTGHAHATSAPSPRGWRQTREATSFDKGVRAFTWLMIRFMVVMVCDVFLIVGLTKGNWVEALLFGLSVAVGLTPEMLPMIITVYLSKGALMMARKKVIVKHLHVHPELRRDGRALHRQDRHAHAGPRGAGALCGRHQPPERGRAALRLHEQLSTRPACATCSTAPSSPTATSTSERNCRKVDEIPFDFQTPAHVRGHRLRGRPRPDLQGRGRGSLRRLQHYQVDEDINPLIN